MSNPTARNLGENAYILGLELDASKDPMFKRYINKEDPPFIDALRSYIEGYLAAKKESDDSAEARRDMFTVIKGDKE